MSQHRRQDTVCVQGGWQPKNGEPRVVPIYQSTTFKYETSEQMGRLFDLEENGYFYTRLANVLWRAVRRLCSHPPGRRPICMQY